MTYKMKGFSYPGKSPMKQKSAHGQEGDYEKEKGLDIAREKTKYQYWLSDAQGRRIKNISKEEYIKYENVPGSDNPTKSTNDPNVSLAKKSADKRGPNAKTYIGKGPK